MSNAKHVLRPKSFSIKSYQHKNLQFLTFVIFEEISNKHF